MKNFTRIIPILAVICGITASNLPVNAGAYLYAGNRKQINCGIIKFSSSLTNQSYELASGYDISLGSGVGELFCLLDSLTNMKPAGWTLENPFAGICASSGKPRKFFKSEVEYWQVDLAGVRDLSRMHVLYLPAHGQVTLNDADREKLRRFVDGGGVLWVDNTSASPALSFGSTGAAGTFFLPYFEFKMQSGTDYAVTRHHPLITIPYWLTDQDIAMLGANAGHCYVCPGYDPQNSDFTGVPDRFEFLFPVVNNSGMNTPPSVASNAYGSGRIVATADYVGRGCYMNYPYNLPSLKFAYNVLALSSTWTNARKDPRHSGNSIDTVGGTKLANTWSLNTAPSSPECAPVIYKNVVFYSSGNTLYALDLIPQEDLDNDGNADDGYKGLPPGIVDKGQDIIWKKDNFDGPISSPTIVTAQDPKQPSNPGQSVDAVLVVSTRGTVYMLNAFPSDATGLLSTTESVMLNACWSTGAVCARPFPPMYVDGWIYVAAGDGRVYALNPVLQSYYGGAAGTEQYWTWQFPPAGFSGYVPSSATDGLESGLCFGYTSAQNTDALIGMLYWSTNPPSTSSSLNDIVYGLPLLARDDRLKIKKIDGNQAACQIAINNVAIADSPSPRVWIKNYPSISISSTLVNQGISGTTQYGYMVITAASAIPSDAIICADYSLAYSDTGMYTSTTPKIKLTLEPDSVSGSTIPPTAVTATSALGPDAMIYINGKRDVTAIGLLKPGGTVYGLRLDGSRQINKWGYFLHAGLTRAMLQGASGSESLELPSIASPTVADMVIPGVVMMKSGAGWVPLQNPQALSSPAYASDKVFVTISGNNGGALACFKASPEFVIRITENAGYDLSGNPVRKAKSLYDITNNRKRSVSIWQPNLMDTSASPLGPLTGGAVQVPSPMIDYDKGTITFDNFSSLKLRSGSLVTNTFSPSLPVWVMLDGVVEVPIDFSTWGPLSAYYGESVIVPPLSVDAVDLSGWNSMLWYYPVTAQVHSSPVVIGDAVYFTDDSGTIYAINTETGETQGKPVGDDQVIWKETSATSGSDTTNFSIAGSNGVLMIPKKDGLYAYSNITTLVADTNRLMELDGAGELSWSADSITWPAHTPPAVNQQPAGMSGPINKPNRVRYINAAEMLVTNSGANQVFRLDKSAQIGIMRVHTTSGEYAYIRWLYDNFSDPKRLLRPGQPKSLNGPTDAILWEEVEKEQAGTSTNTYRVVHCLIADSGNHRIVDLVYKFSIVGNASILVADNSDIDQDSGFCLPRLNWVTTTASTNQDYVYDCIQLVPSTDPAGADIWAAISNYRTGTGTTATNQGLGGAIVAIRYRLQNGSAWNYSTNDSGQIIYGCDRMNYPGVGLAPLASPRYFQVTDTSNGRFIYVCDNYGVYKAQVSSDVPIPTVSTILRDSDYRNLDRAAADGIQALNVPLQANCIHVLPNTNWLITNNYSGTNKDGTESFSGEVFEYNPTGTEIEWHSPNITFSGTGSWKQTIGNGQMMQQPTCAYRQF